MFVLKKITETLIWYTLRFVLECFGYYGVNCEYACSVHCINQTCDRINGSCLFGCEEDGDCGQDISNSFFDNFENCTLCTFEKSKLSMKAVVSNSMNYLYSVLKLFSFLFFRYYTKFKITSVFIRQFACNCWRNSWCIRDCSYRSYFCYVCCTVW